MPLTDSRHRLDEANVQLGKELWLIRSSLAAYRVIGLNAVAINAIGAGNFLGFVQNQSLSAVALGFGKVFERERKDGPKLCSVSGMYRLAKAALGFGQALEHGRDDRFKLCSVSGVYRLTKTVKIQHAASAVAFATRYGITPSQDWVRDVDEVFSRQRPGIQTHMKVIDRFRNTRLAHLQPMAPEGTPLPSIAGFEELLAFAFDFHSFVNEAFLNAHSHPTLSDTQVETSLLHVLEMTGVTNPRSQFEC